MKKIITSMLALIFLLSGCSNSSTNKSEVKSPSDILVENKVVSYYDNPDIYKNNGFSVEEKALNSSKSKSNNVFVNKEGKVRCITILDDTVSTYKNISVGSSISEIENAFQYENGTTKAYAVLFDGNIEVNPKDTKLKKEDGFIWVNYFIDNNVVTKIQIFDALFAKTAQ